MYDKMLKDITQGFWVFLIVGLELTHLKHLVLKRYPRGTCIMWLILFVHHLFDGQFEIFLKSFMQQLKVLRSYCFHVDLC